MRESSDNGVRPFGSEEVVSVEADVPASAEDSQASEPITPEMLESLRKERDEYHDRWLRKQAEFENFRRRVIREKEDLRLAAQSDLLLELLPVLDACDKGLLTMESAGTEVVLAAYLDGYRLLQRQLRQLLERYEVREVPGPGSDFDPRVHEAVLREESDEHDNRILEEFRKGYLIGDRLLRPSQVKVSVLVSKE